MPWPLRMTLYMSLIMLIIHIYQGIKYNQSVRRLQLRPALFYHGIFFVAVVLFFTYPVMGVMEYWTQGSFSYGTYPKTLIYLFWYGAVFLGLSFSWLVAIDLFSLILKRVFKTGVAQRKVFLSYLIVIITGLVAVYAGVKMVWHTHKIGADEISYNLSEVTGIDMEPLTIVHIADLHADRYTRDRKLNRYVNKVNEAEPDIVIFAGDLITVGTHYIEMGADAMARIEARYGVYAVIGDHDYWVNKERVADALEYRGIEVLRDANTWIDHGESRVKLTGVTEIYSQTISTDRLQDLLEEDQGEVLRIVSSHQATDRLIEISKEYGTHQLLAGHTHGGQIRVPVFFYPVTAARAETRYVIGHWWLDDMLLNINNGLGFTLAPVRYNAPAEISVISVY